MKYIKYDENGNIVDQKKEPSESDLKYSKRYE